MAGGGFAAAQGRGGEYEGGVTAFVVITCLVAAMGGLLFGYDLGISGGVTSMDDFLKQFFPAVYRKIKDPSALHESEYCKYDNQLLTLFTSSLYVAALVASFFASATTRAFGRKVSMFVGGISFLIGAILNGLAINIAMLIVGRLMLGVGVGFANQVAVGAMIGLKFGVTGEGSFTKTEADLLLFFICAYVAAFAWSWGPLGWLVPSEICPLEVRSAGQAVNVSVNMFFTFIIAQAFLSMLCHLKFGLFFFFAGFVTIMTIFVYFFVPDDAVIGRDLKRDP